MTDADRHAARKRIKARRDFWSLLATLVVVSILLTGIWYFTGAPRYFWPVWPFLGFAVALVFSGLNAFGVLNRDVTESDIDAELAKRKPRS